MESRVVDEERLLLNGGIRYEVEGGYLVGGHVKVSQRGERRFRCSHC